jgi:hypothetical protein
LQQKVPARRSERRPTRGGPVTTTPSRDDPRLDPFPYCLGALLARLEARIALTALLRRVRSLCRADASPLEALPSPIVYGVRRLPLLVELA